MHRALMLAAAVSGFVPDVTLPKGPRRGVAPANFRAPRPQPQLQPGRRRETLLYVAIDDGSSINMSGAGAGNIVRHNYVFEVASTAFRTDDWQRHTITENNLVYKCRSGFIHKDYNHIQNNNRSQTQ